MDGLIKFQRKDHMQNNSTNLSISKMKFSKEKVTAELSYKYLEKRDYIQGVVVVDGMLKCCEKLLPGIKKNNFKIVEAKINSKINFNTKAIAYFSKKKSKENKNKIAGSKNDIFGNHFTDDPIEEAFSNEKLEYYNNKHSFEVAYVRFQKVFEFLIPNYGSKKEE